MCTLKQKQKPRHFVSVVAEQFFWKSDPGREEMYCRRVQIRFKDFGLIGFWMEC